MGVGGHGGWEHGGRGSTHYNVINFLNDKITALHDCVTSHHPVLHVRSTPHSSGNAICSEVQFSHKFPIKTNYHNNIIHTLVSSPGLHPDFLHGCEIKSGRRPGNEAIYLHTTLIPTSHQSTATCHRGIECAGSTPDLTSSNVSVPACGGAQLSSTQELRT